MKGTRPTTRDERPQQDVSTREPGRDTGQTPARHDTGVAVCRRRRRRVWCRHRTANAHRPRPSPLVRGPTNPQKSSRFPTLRYATPNHFSTVSRVYVVSLCRVSVSCLCRSVVLCPVTLCVPPVSVSVSSRLCVCVCVSRRVHLDGVSRVSLRHSLCPRHPPPPLPRPHPLAVGVSVSLSRLVGCKFLFSFRLLLWWWWSRSPRVSFLFVLPRDTHAHTRHRLRVWRDGGRVQCAAPPCKISSSFDSNKNSLRWPRGRVQCLCRVVLCCVVCLQTKACRGVCHTAGHSERETRTGRDVCVACVVGVSRQREIDVPEILLVLLRLGVQRVA